jgi:hypothetical protein
MCIIYFTIIKVIIMNFEDFSKPTLTEPGIKYFLSAIAVFCFEVLVKTSVSYCVIVTPLQ